MLHEHLCKNSAGRICDGYFTRVLVLVSWQMVIYNWKGLPNKSTMLDNLGVMRTAAAEIGQSYRSRVFGHLVVLLRDVPPNTDDEVVCDLIFGEEDCFEAKTDEEANQITMRNSAREELKDAFQSIRVWSLSIPHVDVLYGKTVRIANSIEK